MLSHAVQDGLHDPAFAKTHPEGNSGFLNHPLTKSWCLYSKGSVSFCLEKERKENLYNMIAFVLLMIKTRTWKIACSIINKTHLEVCFGIVEWKFKSQLFDIHYRYIFFFGFVFWIWVGEHT